VLVISVSVIIYEQNTLRSHGYQFFISLSFIVCPRSGRQWELWMIFYSEHHAQRRLEISSPISEFPSHILAQLALGHGRLFSPIQLA